MVLHLIQAIGHHRVAQILDPQIARDDGILQAHRNLALQLLIAALHSLGDGHHDLGLCQRMIRIGDHLQDAAEQIRD